MTSSIISIVMMDSHHIIINQHKLPQVISITYDDHLITCLYFWSSDNFVFSDPLTYDDDLITYDDHLITCCSGARRSNLKLLLRYTALSLGRRRIEITAILIRTMVMMRTMMILSLPLDTINIIPINMAAQVLDINCRFL